MVQVVGTKAYYCGWESICTIDVAMKCVEVWTLL